MHIVPLYSPQQRSPRNFCHCLHLLIIYELLPITAAGSVITITTMAPYACVTLSTGCLISW